MQQVIRSSGSVGADYIEANEALSKKHFVLQIEICRKEAKESRYWSPSDGRAGSPRYPSCNLLRLVSTQF